MKADTVEISTNTSKAETYWRQHYEAWKASALLKTAYCRNNQLNYAGFMYWQKDLKKQMKFRLYQYS